MELTELNKYPLEHHLSAIFACESSRDGKIAVITDNELIILSYKPDMTNDNNNFLFDEYYIPCSDYHIADQTGIAIEELMPNIPKDQFYRLLMNEIFSPELENTNPHVTKPAAVYWSPIGVYRKTESVLGVLSNTGNVEILIGKTHEWESVVNLTKCLVDVNKEKWNAVSIARYSDSEKCSLHEKRILDCAATCMGWSPKYKNSNGHHIYITVGYLNGEIAIWQLDCIDLSNNSKIIPPKLITTLNVDFKRVTAVHWCPVSENTPPHT